MAKHTRKPGETMTVPITSRQASRILAVVPMIVVTSYVLYKRLVLGEPQKTLHRPPETAVAASREERERH
ncbi:hypothetical protein BDZ89DRAFT_1132407 [Hymenopellis radicata]|nr:hypothetical protein BDZ89DRAFT_1132407 [Hymenopellis radicata]